MQDFSSLTRHLRLAGLSDYLRSDYFDSYMEFDHVPQLTVVNQTLIELSLVLWRESHDVTLVKPDHSVVCSGTTIATRGMKFCPSMRKYAF